MHRSLLGLALVLALGGCVERAALSQRCDDVHGCPGEEACIDGVCGGTRSDGGRAVLDDGGVTGDAGFAGDAGVTPDGGGADAGEVPDGGEVDSGCASGVVAYLDEDEDGVGDGPPLEGCSSLPLPPGLAAVTGDCAPLDDTAWEAFVTYRDDDGDGYTGPEEVVCLGDLGDADPPNTTPAPPPMISLFPASVVGWEAPDEGDLDKKDNRHVEFRFDKDGSPTSPALIISDFATSRPAGAALRGVRVTVTRRASDNDLEIRDETVQLVSDGVVVGENRALSSPWQSGWLDVVYGGPDDTWGAALSADNVATPGFGLALQVRNLGNDDPRARIDRVVIETFFADGPPECDDSDPQGYATFDDAVVDADGDRYAAGVAGTLCGDLEVKAGYTVRPRGQDCYDENASAHPDAIAYFSSHRGDGSFDYDCDLATTKQAVTDASACYCTIVSTCAASSSTSYTPSAACGELTPTDVCGGACPACAPSPGTTTVRCR